MPLNAIEPLGFTSYLPTVGEPYPGRVVAEAMMLTGAPGVFLLVGYHDEQGRPQVRGLSVGCWPIRSTRINGVGTIGQEFLKDELSTHAWQLSVLLR